MDNSRASWRFGARVVNKPGRLISLSWSTPFLSFVCLSHSPASVSWVEPSQDGGPWARAYCLT